MSQLLKTPLGMEWFRHANKYLENLHKEDTSKYGTVTVIRHETDDSFVREFDFIAQNMGF